MVPRRDRELPATPEEVPLHVVDALQEDLDPRHAPRFPRSSEFELSVQNRFAALDFTARESWSQAHFSGWLSGGHFPDDR